MATFQLRPSEGLIKKEILEFCFCRQRLESWEGENWIFALTHTASLFLFDAYTEWMLQSLWYLRDHGFWAHLSFSQCTLDCKQILQFILLWFSNSGFPWTVHILTGLSYQQVAVSCHSVWLLIGSQWHILEYPYIHNRNRQAIIVLPEHLRLYGVRKIYRGAAFLESLPLSILTFFLFCLVFMHGLLSPCCKRPCNDAVKGQVLNRLL